MKNDAWKLAFNRWSSHQGSHQGSEVSVGLFCIPWRETLNLLVSSMQRWAYLGCKVGAAFPERGSCEVAAVAPQEPGAGDGLLLPHLLRFNRSLG